MINEFTTRIVVPSEHPSFAGHFPGRPIVPGVVLLDLIVASIERELAQPLQVLVIPSTKFQRPVSPEEAVDVAISIVPGEQPRTFRARFRATCGAAPVTEGSLVLMLAAVGG